MADKVTMYSTVWCGHCRRLQRQLTEAGIAYDVVDIEEETSHGSRIEAVTGGYRIVPTIEIHGRLLVNPSVEEVRGALVN